MTEDANFPDQSEFLSLSNVNVARGERVVLHDINLIIRTGEHVAAFEQEGVAYVGQILAHLYDDLPTLPRIPPRNASPHLRP